MQRAVQHVREGVWMLSKTLVRYSLSGIGVILALMGLSGISGSVWLLMLGLLALFLGITDFGRQCPLILSARHLVYRIRSKGKPRIVSAEPIKEVSEGVRRKMPS